MVTTLLLSSLLHAHETPVLEQLTLKDGLSQSTVFSIAQDHTGFMWFGGRNGLNRYDGYHFRPYFSKDGLPSNFIWSLLRDGETLWLGTQGAGLIQRQPGGKLVSHSQSAAYAFTSPLAPAEPDEVRRDADPLPKVVVDIQHSLKGGLWLATQDAGLQYYDKRTETFTSHSPEPDTSARSVLEDSVGNVWLGTEQQGVSRFDVKAETWTTFRNDPDNPDSLSHNGVWDVLEDSNYRIWVATFGGGLNRLDIRTGKFTHYRFDPDDPQSLSNDFVWKLLEDRKGRIWVGTNGGLNLLDPVNGTFQRFLPGQEIKSIFEDRSGILWVGTYYGGVFKLDDKRSKFQVIDNQPGNPNTIASDTVNGVYEEEDGTLWVVGDGGGLNRIDPDDGAVTRYQYNPKDDRSISNNHPMNIMRLNDGDFLLGTYSGGMNRFNPDSGAFTRFLPDPLQPDSISDDTVFDILQDQQGRVWVATWRGGLNQYHPRSGTFTPYRHEPDKPDSLGDDYVQTLLEDSQGRLWLGTATAGLNLFLPEEKRFVQYEHSSADPASISHNHVYSMLERSDGKIWVGTESGGLNLFDPDEGSFTHFIDSRGYLQSAILGILEADDGLLWISTRDGLLSYNPENNFAHRYDEGDGVQSTEFIAGSQLKGRNGVFYFGGVNGLNFFQPETVEHNSFVPPVVITGLEVMQAHSHRDIDLEARSSVVLGYADQPFTIQFAALNYTRTNLNRYRYKLEGVDRSWLADSASNQAVYHRVSPGTYTFHVRGSNNDGVWNATPATLTIEVLPPWWLSTWAYAVYFSLAGMLLLVYWRWQQRTLNAERERDVAQRSELAKQEFFAKMSHELRTPLSGLLGMGELLERTHLDSTQKHYVESQLRAGNTLLNIVNDILELSKIDAHKLELTQAPFNLKHLIEDLVELFSVEVERRKIHIHINYPVGAVELFLGDPMRLRQVLSNLIGNAVKFTDEGAIWIDVMVTTQQPLSAKLVIQIKDSGVGIEEHKLNAVFDQFYQVSEPAQNAYQGTGLGLSIARQLVELMGGALDIVSQYGVGTTVSLKLSLPVVTDGSAEPEKTVAPEDFYCRARILIVEDNEINAQALMYLLESFGCEVKVVTDGLQALSYLELHDVDLVFMDCHLPRMDGITAAKRLRQDVRWKELPIVALTASISLKDKAGCRNVGINAYLLKPLLTEKAIQVLMKYCHHRCTKAVGAKADRRWGRSPG
ncbi:hybrid sensor histidine kinase/response regulator transcription factor [Pseudomaricurvus hydrocarbonicus]